MKILEEYKMRMYRLNIKGIYLRIVLKNLRIFGYLRALRNREHLCEKWLLIVITCRLYWSVESRNWYHKRKQHEARIKNRNKKG